MTSPYLTEREAADRARYLDRGAKNPVRAFQRWARRAGVPVKYVGRSRLYEPRILDAFLDRETWTRRHRPLPVAAGERRPGPTLVSNGARRSR